jgi:hypothetical protein
VFAPPLCLRVFAAPQFSPSTAAVCIWIFARLARLGCPFKMPSLTTSTVFIRFASSSPNCLTSTLHILAEPSEVLHHRSLCHRQSCWNRIHSIGYGDGQPEKDRVLSCLQSACLILALNENPSLSSEARVCVVVDGSAFQ